MPSAALEDYLKAIYKLAEQSEAESVSTSAIADRLGVARASVTAMLKKLHERGLITHTPYYGASLTAQGRQIAIEMIRRHRVIEAFLVQMLEIPLDQVDAEAEVLEHAFSSALVDRLWHKLGCPRHDPHGAPIPAPNEMPSERRRLITLNQLVEGGVAIVARIAADDVEQLRTLIRLGIKPGVVIQRLVSSTPSKVLIRMDHARSSLDTELAQAVLLLDPDAGVEGGAARS